MFTAVWNKYLPVIRILFKKAIREEQQLQLNQYDFEKTGTQRKGTRFTIDFSSPHANMPPAAKELKNILLDDAVIKDLVSRNGYQLSMNTKFLLTLKMTPGPEAELPVADQAQEKE
jgi:hypothetical protein